MANARLFTRRGLIHSQVDNGHCPPGGRPHVTASIVTGIRDWRAERRHKSSAAAPIGTICATCFIKQARISRTLQRASSALHFQSGHAARLVAGHTLGGMRFTAGILHNPLLRRACKIKEFSMFKGLMRLSVALTVSVVLAGCGGGGGGGGTSGGGGTGGGGGGGGGGNTATTTRVVMNVDWPARSRNISGLSSAQSIKVVLTGANSDNSDFTWVANRDADLTAHTQRLVSPTLTRVGHWTAALTLYSLPNGGGVIVGTAGDAIDLKADGTGLDSLVVNGVITTVAVAPGQAVALNQTADLVFQAKDANSNLVAVTPGSATWQEVSGQDVLQVTSDGKAKSLAVGTASVKVTIDGKTSAAADVASGPSSATINVSVKDPFNAALPNVTIDLFQNGTSQQRVVLATGTQAITTTLLGQVDVHATKTGYNPGQTTITINRLSPVSANITLSAIGKPSVSTGGSRVISNDGTSLTFETDVSVVDAAGSPITGLAGSAFSIDPATLKGAGNAAIPVSGVTLSSVNYTSVPGRGPVSAFIELDASGSVSSVSDPSAVRIQAAKTYFSALGGGDEAMLGYFPAANNSPDLKTFPGTTFVTDGTLYYPYLDQIRDLGFLLGSPLFHATIQAIDITAAQGKNANKAVVLFTDGQPAADTATIDQAVAEANAKGVRVYAAGLGTATNLPLLTDIAQRTGGSVLYAQDAGQLVTFYKTLGNLLQGAGSFYRTRWVAVRSSGTFKSGDTVFGLMTVNAAGSAIQTPFIVHVP